MEQLAVHCHGCRSPISASDVEKRRVVIVLKRAYCRDCADQITTRRVAPHKRRSQVIIAAIILVCVLAISAVAMIAQ